MGKNISDLTAFIVCYAGERDINLTTLRLVKFLYLADLYFARHHSGQTFTGFPWRFVHYGPYCAEVLQEIDLAESQGLIDAGSMESKFVDKDYTLYTCREGDSARLRKNLPDEMISPLQRAIRKYGDDTPALLDYVYFDTEPMEGVRKGNLLDFSKARPQVISEPVPVRRLSKAEVEEGRKHIRALVEQSKRGQQNLISEDRRAIELRDDLYYDTIEALDGEELRPGLTGTAHIVD